MKKLALLLSVGLTACEGPTTPDVSTVPVLISPAEGAIVPQTGPFSCSLPTGWNIRFEWQPAPATAEVVGYQIVAEAAGAASPIVGAVTDATNYTSTSCGGYVADRNLTGWEWRVRTVDRAGRYGEWSAPRRFQFAPCRVDGRACEVSG